MELQKKLLMSLPLHDATWIRGYDDLPGADFILLRAEKPQPHAKRPRWWVPHTQSEGFVENLPPPPFDLGHFDLPEISASGDVDRGAAPIVYLASLPCLMMMMLMMMMMMIGTMGPPLREMLVWLPLPELLLSLHMVQQHDPAEQW